MTESRASTFAVQYVDVAELRGPLLVVRGVAGVGWDESALVRLHSGELRHGLVLEVDRDLAVVQVLEGTDGMRPGGTRVTFAGEALQIPVGAAGWVASATAAASRWTTGRPCWPRSGPRCRATR